MNILAVLVFAVCLIGSKGETFQRTSDLESRQEPAQKESSWITLRDLNAALLELELLMYLTNDKKPTNTLPEELPTDHKNNDPSTSESEETQTNPKPMNPNLVDRNEGSAKPKTNRKKDIFRRTIPSKLTQGMTKKFLCVIGVLPLVGLVMAVCFIKQMFERKEKMQ